jgi:hypothetical protein
MDNHDAKRQKSSTDSVSDNGLRSNLSDAISALAEREHYTMIDAYNKAGWTGAVVVCANIFLAASLFSLSSEPRPTLYSLHVRPRLCGRTWGE